MVCCEILKLVRIDSEQICDSYDHLLYQKASDLSHASTIFLNDLLINVEPSSLTQRIHCPYIRKKYIQSQERFTPSYSNFSTPNKTRRDATSISAQRKGGADLPCFWKPNHDDSIFLIAKSRRFLFLAAKSMRLHFLLKA